MKNQGNSVDLSNVSDDVLIDAAVERLKAMYTRKSGKEAMDVCFEISARYSRFYEISMYRRQDFYRSQPKLSVLPEP